MKRANHGVCFGLVSYGVLGPTKSEINHPIKGIKIGESIDFGLRNKVI